MKILFAIIKTILAIILMFVVTALVTFILSIFLPENVTEALQIFKNLLGIA